MNQEEMNQEEIIERIEDARGHVLSAIEILDELKTISVASELRNIECHLYDLQKLLELGNR